jgi:type I restriction enzyme M protein
VENFPSIAETLEKRLADWSEASDSPDPSDSSDDPPKKTLPERTKRRLLDPTTWERDARLVEAATALRKELGGDLFGDYNIFRDRVDAAVKKLDLDLTAPDLKLILRVVSWRVETAPPVIAKQQKLKPGEKVMDEEKLHGWADLRTPKSAFRIQFEPDPDLRDTEQVPLLEPGGIEAFIRREVLPYMRLISVCATWG